MAGIDQRPVGEPACHGVHGEIPAGEIVLDGRRGIDNDLEVAPPGRHVTARRRQFDAGAHELSHLGVAGMEADADGAPGHDKLLHTAVRSERRVQALDVDTRNQESPASLASCPSRSSRTAPPTTYASSPKRADINRWRSGAIASISTSAPDGKFRDLDGGTRGAESNRPGPHSCRSCRRSRRGFLQQHRRAHNGRARTSASSRIARRLTKTCSVCALMSPGTRSFSPGRKRSWPETNTKPFASIACDRRPGTARALGANDFLRHESSLVSGTGDRPGRAPHRPP